MPLAFGRDDLKNLANASLCAAHQILWLLDQSIRPIATKPNFCTAPRWCFNYQDRFAGPGADRWAPPGSWVRKHEIHALPLFTDFKLSVLRSSAGLQLQLSADAALMDASQAHAFLKALRNSLIREAASC
ncbi:hypothetical protein D3C85_1340030 [compost metagenome]